MIFRGFHMRKCLRSALVLVLILHFVSPSFAGTTRVPKRGKKTSGTEKLKTEPPTSIERPPVLTSSFKKSGNYDDAGVTFPPLKSSFKSTLTNLDLWGSIKRFKSAFSRISNVFSRKSSSGLSEGRAGYMEGWMEGAMVPMTFLLMAAFIMDILQRLFPLPYATFVDQAYHRSAVVTTPKPMDLTKVQLNTPLGNFGVETNDKNGFNLFGRSNQGNPGFVPSEAYSNSVPFASSAPFSSSSLLSNSPSFSSDSSDTTMLDLYLKSLLSSNNTEPVVIDSSDGMPGWSGYSPGPGPIESLYKGSDPSTIDNSQGGYGYGGTPGNMNSGGGGTASEGSYGSSSNNNDPGGFGSSSNNEGGYGGGSTNKIPGGYEGGSTSNNEGGYGGGSTKKSPGGYEGGSTSSNGGGYSGGSTIGSKDSYGGGDNNGNEGGFGYGGASSGNMNSGSASAVINEFPRGSSNDSPNTGGDGISSLDGIDINNIPTLENFNMLDYYSSDFDGGRRRIWSE